MLTDLKVLFIDDRMRHKKRKGSKSMFTSLRKVSLGIA